MNIRRPFYYLLLAGLLISGTGRARADVISGQNLDGKTIVVTGPGSIDHCKITGATTITLSPQCHDFTLDSCSFDTTANCPVRGYPGNNVSITNNTFSLAHVNTAGPDNNPEAIHLLNANDGLSISGNSIDSPGLLRWAIELQNGMTNLKVQRNYIHCAKGGSGLSLAIGGDATAPFAHAGENVDVSWNVVVADANPYQSCALEIDGDKNISVHDNYFSGFAWGITNGTGGQQNQGLVTANNVIVYITSAYADGDNTPWKVPARVSTNDSVFKVGTAGIPPIPTSIAPALPAVVASTVPHPTNLTGTPVSTSEIDLNWTDASGGQATYVITRKSTHGSDAPITIATLPAGAIAYKDTSGLQATWQYDYTVSAVEVSASSLPMTITAQALAVNPAPAPPDLPTMEADVATKLQAYQAAAAAYVAALKAAAGQ